MALRLSLLLLLPVIYARIEVEISTANNDDPIINLSGHNVDIISQIETQTFKLHDENLKDAVRSYFGARPSDAYLRGPTPWGDLYQTYNWAQVQRILAPQRAKVLSLATEPSMVSTQVFENNSSMPINIDAQISQTVENVFTSAWERSAELTVGAEISYEIKLEATLGGKTQYSYSHKWGESLSKSEAVTVGSTQGVSVSLEPRQKLVAELYATRGTMKVQVDYEATLSGIVAVNYDEEYKGHHFWSMDVNEVLKAHNLPTAVKSSEIIELSYYSDSRVIIKDLVSNVQLYSIPLSLH